MQYLERLIRAYGYAIRQTINSIKGSPQALLIVPIAGLIYSISQMILSRMVGLSGLGGFIMPLINSAVLSVVLQSLLDLIDYDSFSITKIRYTMAFTFLWDVYFIQFVLFLLGYVTNGLSINASLFYIILFIVFSGIPEEIYLGKYRRMELITSQLDYLKRNFYIWLPIILALASVSERIAIVTNQMFVGWTIFGYHTGAFFIPTNNVSHLVLWLVFQMALSIVVVLRGHLFKYTQYGNVRKDQYRQGMRG
ncbi:MAG: hypothetical protein GXZ11_05545 [Tissierellia bacterium]|nr:hypothetical protein [Tissierellia bacterium]